MPTSQRSKPAPPAQEQQLKVAMEANERTPRSEEIPQDGSAIIDTIYPSGTIKSLSFDEAPLALYEGAFSLRSKKFEGAMIPPRKIMLTFQACSDEVCLPPEDMIFVLW